MSFFLFSFLEVLRMWYFAVLQAAGAGESWNHIYTQPQPGSSCDAAVHVYNQQTFLHTFLSQKSKCSRVQAYLFVLLTKPVELMKRLRLLPGDSTQREGIF